MEFVRALCIALALSPVVGFAHDYQLKSLSIDHPFTRATPPGAKSGGAFFVVENASPTPDKLIGAASPAAGAVEIHQMVMDGGVMKMRAMPALEVPAGGKLELKPGGYHVMLIDLKRPLKKGDIVPLKLKIQGPDKQVTTVEVKAEVRDPAAPPP